MSGRSQCLVVRASGAMCACVLTMTACGQGAVGTTAPDIPVSVTQFGGLPSGIATPSLIPPTPTDLVEWHGDDQLAVVTYGSSGCPRLVTAVSVSSPTSLIVTVGGAPSPPAGSSCSADLAPTTSVTTVPTGVDVKGPVKVTIADGAFGTTVTLAPR